MRVMTFNLRFENDRDGPNSWVYRRDLVTDVIRNHRPSILGTQEGRWNMLLYLKERLPEYTLHAPDRVLDDTCQYPTLFFGREDFKLLEGGEFWLSKTPEVHRSLDWDSAFPRMLSYAALACKGEGDRFWVGVTHLDHVGVAARLRQAEMLARWVKDRSGPVILMGDFNDAPDSPVHRVLTDPGVGLEDTWRILGRSENARSHTHHGFEGVPQKTRMDWILATRHFRAADAWIIHDHRGRLYPSDHFPYMVELSLEQPFLRKGNDERQHPRGDCTTETVS